jgi:hypothetical protein
MPGHDEEEPPQICRPVVEPLLAPASYWGNADMPLPQSGIASKPNRNWRPRPDLQRHIGYSTHWAIQKESWTMTDIKQHMEVIGADGVHIGTVDKIEGNRIKLTKKDSGEGSHRGHHHYIDRGLVAGVEGNKVRLSSIGAVAVTLEEEKR